MLTVQVFTILFIYRSKQIRMLGHFIEKVPLHLKQVGHFTGKRYFIGNGIQAYNPLQRKMRLHCKSHSYLQ